MYIIKIFLCLNLKKNWIVSKSQSRPRVNWDVALRLSIQVPISTTTKLRRHFETSVSKSKSPRRRNWDVTLRPQKKAGDTANRRAPQSIPRNPIHPDLDTRLFSIGFQNPWISSQEHLRGESAREREESEILPVGAEILVILRRSET
jgi:hypothetical protein